MTSCLRSSFGPLALALSLTLSLGACGSYQAPISDQGESLPESRPEIVASGNDQPERIVERSRRANGSGSSTASVVRSAVGATTRRSSDTTAPAASRDRQARTAAASGGMYQVNDGDTLYSIAFEYDLDFRGLAAANGLRPPYTIFVGQELRLSAEAAASPSITAGTAVSNNNRCPRKRNE